MSKCATSSGRLGDLGIRSSTGTSIARTRAPEDGAVLGRGVADGVVWGVAPSLEGVVQSNPMPKRDPMISLIPSGADAKK